MIELTNNNINIIGSFNLNEEKTKEYKKLENIEILKTSLEMSVIGFLLIANIINHLMIILPRLSFLLTSIVVSFFMIYLIGSNKKKLDIKLRLLDTDNRTIDSIKLTKNTLNIVYHTLKKETKQKIMKLKNVKKIETFSTEYNLDLINNILYLPYSEELKLSELQIETENLYEFKRDLTIKLFFKTILSYFIFEILTAIILRNLIFFLIISIPITFIFIIAYIIIVEEKKSNCYLSEIEKFQNMDFIEYNNKTFIFVKNNFIEKISLPNFKENLKDITNIKIDLKNKIIYVPIKKDC